jgi:hypothetical protein
MHINERAIKVRAGHKWMQESRPAGLAASCLRVPEEDGAAAGAGPLRVDLGFEGGEGTPPLMSATVTGLKRLPCFTLRSSSPRVL